MQNKKQDSVKRSLVVRIIGKYYLGFFVGFILVFLVGPSTTRSAGTFWGSGVTGLGWALLISVFCGTLYYFQDTKWGPAKRKKILLKSPFTELFQNGFIKYGDVAVGTVGDYTVILSYKWLARKSVIKMDILFELGFRVYQSDDVLRNIIHRNPPANRFSSLAHEWTQNSIGCKFEYHFKAPSYGKLMAKAEELIEILVREQLVPISLDRVLHVERPVS